MIVIICASVLLTAGLASAFAFQYNIRYNLHSNELTFPGFSNVILGIMVSSESLINTKHRF